MKHRKCELLASAYILHNIVVILLETENVKIFLKDMACTCAIHCMTIFGIIFLEKHNS